VVLLQKIDVALITVLQGYGGALAETLHWMGDSQREPRMQSLPFQASEQSLARMIFTEG
jgi:hypothetical protein